MATVTQYTAFRSALSGLVMALSAYMNDPNTGDADSNAALSVDKSVDSYLTRIGQFQVEQFDGTKLDTAAKAVQAVTTFVKNGAGTVGGSAIVKTWAGARPAVENAIPGLTAVQALSAIPP